MTTPSFVYLRMRDVHVCARGAGGTLYTSALSCVLATVLAKGLSVLWRMTTVHASKVTPLEGV